MRARWALSLLLPACAPSDASVQVAHESLRGGQPTATRPAVVAVVGTPVQCGEESRVICSGTLIEPQVVLTAAHCLDLAPPGTLAVSVGPDVRRADELVLVAEQRAHPAWRGREHDLALLYLAHEPHDVAPIALDAEPPDALTEALRVVGYGTTDNGELGRKQHGTSRLQEVRPLELVLAPAPALSCDGDSGGPALRERAGVERVLGVATGGDPACERTGLYARIDVDLHGFLAPTLEAWTARPPAARRALLAEKDLCSSTCVRDVDCPMGAACVTTPDGRRCGRAGLPPGRFRASCDDSSASECLSLGDACRTYTSCHVESRGCALTSGGARRVIPLALLLAVATALRRRTRHAARAGSWRCGKKSCGLLVGRSRERSE